MFERHSQPLLSREAFVRRMARHGGIAGLVVLASLGVGTVGFHYWALQSWIDGFLNSAMLLGGMGPVGEIQSNGGKFFASVFALYAGLVFITVAALIIAPALHRLLHHFHLSK